MKTANITTILVLGAIVLMVCLGCRFLVPPKAPEIKDPNSPLTWKDLPAKQSLPAEIAPYMGKITDLLPPKVTGFTLIESKDTVSALGQPIETWTALYQSNSSEHKPNFRLYMANYRTSDEAFKELVTQVMERIGGEITTIEPAVKNGKTVGTKVCMRKPGSRNKCEDVIWTNSTVTIAMWEDKNTPTDIEPFFQTLPF